ncbi:hypothetical protein SLA2020_338550 [Shorea laevis]
MWAPRQDEGVLVLAERDDVFLYEEILRVGLRFPILSQIQSVLVHLNLTLAQLIPNGWGILLAYSILWPMILEGRPNLIVREFLSTTLSCKAMGFGAFIATRPSGTSLICSVTPRPNRWQIFYKSLVYARGDNIIFKPHECILF